METEEQTLIEEDGASTTEETLNETGDTSTPRESADLVSTTEYEAEPSEEKSKTEEPEKTQETKETKGEDEKGKSVSEAVPYDRFQEMVENKNQWQKRAEAAEKTTEKEPVVHEDVLPANFTDLSVLSNDDLSEMMEDKPMNFIKNLATQIQYETLKQVQTMFDDNSKQSAHDKQQEGIKTTFDKYAADNAGFNKMWDTGEIKKFMDANPGHNAISAHQALTVEQRIADAVAEAIEKTEKRKDTQTKTKQSARVLSAGSPARISKESGELKNTKIHGGLTAVIAKRLAARRRSA
jgi:hypothetical protein